jgi:hypothetical protein
MIYILIFFFKNNFKKLRKNGFKFEEINFKKKSIFFGIKKNDLETNLYMIILFGRDHINTCRLGAAQEKHR